jgi:hypothetical protein
MNSFSFQNIQSLEITAADQPSLNVADDQLILTATRNGSRIMITAPLSHIIPTPVQTTVKSNVKASRMVSSLKGKTLDPSDDRVGEKNSNAKLNVGQVKEIRGMLKDDEFMGAYKSRTAAHREIARWYKVDTSCIYQIDNNLTWKHVTI